MLKDIILLQKSILHQLYLNLDNRLSKFKERNLRDFHLNNWWQVKNHGGLK